LLLRVIATRLHRFEPGRKDGLLGAVNLRVPDWHLTLLGCLWKRDAILLPRRQWLRKDCEQESEVFVFDDLDRQQEFEGAAFAGIDELLRRTRRP
jgi:hypothetical protein